MLLIFSRPNCAFCSQTKKYLDSLGVKWEERSALDHQDYPALANLFGFTVPLIFNPEKNDGMVGWNIRRLKELI